MAEHSQAREAVARTETEPQRYELNAKDSWITSDRHLLSHISTASVTNKVKKINNRRSYISVAQLAGDLECTHCISVEG